MLHICPYQFKKIAIAMKKSTKRKVWRGL